MKPVDLLLLAMIAVIVASAGWFVYRSKKSGKKCIGCPNGGSCSGNCGSCGDKK